jgi:hypothetical protein
MIVSIKSEPTAEPLRTQSKAFFTKKYSDLCELLRLCGEARLAAWLRVGVASQIPFLH